MSTELKIKSKHLGEEAKIIRFEEHKLRKQIDWLESRQEDASKVRSTWLSIKDHRRKDVRNENRATFLARAFIAGKPYSAVEAKVHDAQLLRFLVTTRVTEMVAKYGRKMVKRWDSYAKAHRYDVAEYAALQNELLSWIEN